MKLKLIMCKGLPASGKSTWAREMCQKGYKRINKDDLRAMIDNGKWSKKNEEFILLMRDTMALSALKDGMNVIIDDTNLDPKHALHLELLAKECNADFEIKDFTNVPLLECLDRDRKRTACVGEKVIKDMYNRYLKPKTPTVEYIEGAKEIIICDLDGTIALHNGRSPYDTEKCETDLLNQPVFEVLSKFGMENVIFVSGREDKFRLHTIRWLALFGMYKNELFMRPTGDIRNDAIVKKEIYDNFIKGKYNVKFVLDDRNRVVDMWREQGLTCLQVASGDF